MSLSQEFLPGENTELHQCKLAFREGTHWLNQPTLGGQGLKKIIENLVIGNQ
jgi:hypothetical protein